MLEIVAELIGFFGAALIGISIIGCTSRPRTVTITGTALIIVACWLLLLIAFKVAK